MRRLTIVLAIAAAFSLVSVAQAAAATLKVNVAGSGSGEVLELVGLFNEEGEPAAIACSYASPGPATGVCENTMGSSNSNTAIGVRAGEGSEFTGWTINQGQAAAWCDGSNEEAQAAFELSEFNEEWQGLDGVCAIEPVGGTAEITATFEAEATIGPPLTVAIEEGAGAVVSNPKGLQCSGNAPHECTTGAIEAGKEVVLTASPLEGYMFKSWKNCDSGGVNGRQCTITLTEGHKPVGAKFVPVQRLEIFKTTAAPGIATTSPGGINCGYACTSSTALYNEGAVTLKAKPAKNFHFVKFTGGQGSAESCNEVTAETCTFTMSSAGKITEIYAENAKTTLIVNKEGGGQGFIKTKPTNVNCGSTCTVATAEFFTSEEPEVTVALGKGTEEVTWVHGSGTCTGHALTCKVSMSTSHTLLAKFE